MVSPTMQTAMEMARQYGRLVRLRGGFWTYPGCPRSNSVTTDAPEWYVATGTIQALIARGMLTRDVWVGTNPSFCVEVVPAARLAMLNKAMERKLNAFEALDVYGWERTVEEDYVVPAGVVIEGMDLCDAVTEQWIWSVGFNGLIRVASITPKFYQRAGWDCVWLR